MQSTARVMEASIGSGSSAVASGDATAPANAGPIVEAIEVLGLMQESAAAGNASVTAGIPTVKTKATVAPTTPSIATAESAVRAAPRRVGETR